MIDIIDFIRARAAELGFHTVGIARVGAISSETRHLESWISKGFHADMGYMERWGEVRADPAHSGMVSGARSVVCFAMACDRTNPPEGLARDLARFARGPDYHQVLRHRLTLLLKDLRRRDPDLRGRALVDSAPLFERFWAARAGLGWIGRNTCLINPLLGSFFVLGELVLTVDLEPSEPDDVDRCGECRLCVEACPTGALQPPDGRVLDSRLCLSYLSVEAKSTVSQDLERHPTFFGCDRCQVVCPWNSGLQEVSTPLATLDRWSEISLEDVAEMKPDGLSRILSNTSLKRVDPKVLIRRAQTMT